MRSIEKLGAHLTEINGHAGVLFCRLGSQCSTGQRWWVTLMDGTAVPVRVRRRVEAGIWEIFIPGVGENDHYKYEVRNCFGNIVLKSDPFSGSLGSTGCKQHLWSSISIAFNGVTTPGSRNARLGTGQNNLSAFMRCTLDRGGEGPEEHNRYLSYMVFSCRSVDPLCQRNGLHPYRTATRSRASV